MENQYINEAKWLLRNNNYSITVYQLAKWIENDRKKPPVWKNIKGWRGEYQVNQYGQVKSVGRFQWRRCTRTKSHWAYKKGILLRPFINHQGYVTYFLYNRKRNQTAHFSRHQLIGQYFIPNPKNKKEINHKNCIRVDNRIINLEWATRKENAHHSIKNSKYTVCLPGEKNPASRLTDKKVIAIRKAKGTQEKIAVMYGISRSNVGLIKRGERWKHLL